MALEEMMLDGEWPGVRRRATRARLGRFAGNVAAALLWHDLLRRLIDGQSGHLGNRGLYDRKTPDLGLQAPGLRPHKLDL